MVEARVSVVLRKKSYPALIARFRRAMFGYFWPIFFFADHNPTPPAPHAPTASCSVESARLRSGRKTVTIRWRSKPAP